MSENENALHESLELYKSQLNNIKSALEIASDEQKPDLQQIEKDLEEIIQLTQASLLNTNESNIGDGGETSVQQEQSSLENELGALEGVKCKVPFQYEWGGLGFHNAIILGTEIDEDDGSVHINVVFMHPTSKKMKPCPYYLEGHCKYSDDTCHYSHGYSVQLDQVQNYKEPDYNQITEGSTVLAKYKDELWYRGCVEDIVKDTEFSVKFLHNSDVLLLNLHSIFPLEENESDDSSSNEDDGEDVTFAPRPIETLDLIAHHDPSSFGHWEKHTKGIGGKLMTKMGYVYGSGLGKEGEGRIEPVQAVVFPPGRSLDRCMELREKAGNEDLLSVEKRLERQKAKEERRLRQLKTATEREASVFDFINSKLASKKTQDDGKSSNARPKMANLSGLSHEKLNVQSFQISEDIRKAERDIAHTKLSLQRQSARGDLASVAQIRARLAEKEKNLERLRSSDRTIANEQKQRKSSSKLTIF